MAVKKRQKALSTGRPPIPKERERMSSKQSRTIIRTHHRLQKEHAAAVKKGDIKTADDLSKRIENNGGIKVYQAASKQGQAKTRGGDSSKVLVEWLREAKIIGSNGRTTKEPYRLLEVGALSTENEISKFPKTVDVTRIDLNSQGPGITQQDFMQRPLPTGYEEQFDIISLSLVLNYVPEPVGRGDMLKRITKFLRKPLPEDEVQVLPALFLVLPLPCVSNSRYLDEKLLLELMENLGFEMKMKNDTLKLCYYLFTLAGQNNGVKGEKKKIRDGHGMNNFCIVVD
jgi:25S rRNA (adenine2142-N1)-methyltransferase